MVKLVKPVRGIFDLTISLIDTKYLVIPEFKAYVCIYPLSAKLLHFKMSIMGHTYPGILN